MAEEEKMEVDEEAKEEAKEEVKDEEEEKDDAMEEEEEDNEPPKVELTAEEKKMWFRPQTGGTDLTQTVLNASFSSFSIPQKAEGFDDVKFEWQSAEASNKYLRNWVLEKKRTSRIEDLQPGPWFQEKVKE